MNEIVNMIGGDLSFEELSEITKTALSCICFKLREEGLYEPVGIIKSLGENSYDVDIVIIDGRSHSTGESYEQMFYL